MSSSSSATLSKSADTTAVLHPLLADRWSPRAFDASHDVTAEQIATLLEASRWAPSASNTQPWRFVVAPRGSANHASLFATLKAPNQVWAGAAGVLILVAAQTVDDAGTPLPYATYDAGQAVHALVTQAHAEGLFAHQLGGFDHPAAAEAFGLGDSLAPLVVVAVGRHDPSAALPEPFATREAAPAPGFPSRSCCWRSSSRLASGVAGRTTLLPKTVRRRV